MSESNLFIVSSTVHVNWNKVYFLLDVFCESKGEHPQKHDKDEFLSWDYEQMCTHDKQCAADMCEYAYIQGDKKFEWFGVTIDEKLQKDVKCSLGL